MPEKRHDDAWFDNAAKSFVVSLRWAAIILAVGGALGYVSDLLSLIRPSQLRARERRKPSLPRGNPSFRHFSQDLRTRAFEMFPFPSLSTCAKLTMNGAAAD